MNSLFRKLQNNIIKNFALENSFKLVVEIGGTHQFNNSRFFGADTKFILTNLKDEDCDQVEDITQLSFGSNNIESILCISVLQHVFDFNKGIDEILRVLKPGGKALITNGFIFPVCMKQDFFRFTPAFWEERLRNEQVNFKIISIGNQYHSIENILMRPYNKIGGMKGVVNKFMAIFFRTFKIFYPRLDSAPLGVAVIIEKNI
jgi:SAM-dependent methyltransferase